MWQKPSVLGPIFAFDAQNPTDTRTKIRIPAMIGRLLNRFRSHPPAASGLSGQPEDDLAQAIELVNQKLPEAALPILQRQLARQPESREGWLWLARALIAARRFEEADEAFFEAIALAADPALKSIIRGEQARVRGDTGTALDELRQALGARPSDPECANQLGLALEAAGRTAEAESIYRQALDHNPGARQLLGNLANLLSRVHGIDVAAPLFEEGLRRHPRDAVLRYNYATNCATANRTQKAIELLRDALACDASLRPAKMSLALELFRLGRMREGCIAFEARWDCVPSLRDRYTLPPDLQWRGADLTGKSILLWAEQGLGDSLQMARYIAMLPSRGPQQIHVRAPRSLLRLFSCIAGVSSLVAEEDSAPLVPFDLHCPFMSLPLAFDTTLDSIPATLPYLHAEPAEVARWKNDLPARPGHVRAGLVWRSDPQGDVWSADARATKSIPFGNFDALRRVEKVTWISLQLGARQDEIGNTQTGIDLFDPTANIRDFADTAAIVEQLDLVVTVDTAVAHLAAAMGKPVLMLLKFGSGLFWLLGRDDSPWYPGVLRIVRQSKAGEWREAIDRSADLVEQFIRRRTLWDRS